MRRSRHSEKGILKRSGLIMPDLSLICSKLTESWYDSRIRFSLSVLQFWLMRRPEVYERTKQNIVPEKEKFVKLSDGHRAQ